MRLLILFFYRWLSTAKRQDCSKGFTLLELLMSMVVSSIVIVGLLGVVVELTTMEKRESSLDQVQRDMQRAMDYITDDLQEAVYVYADPQQVVDNGLDQDSAFPDETGDVPVLAFWRIDPIEEDLPACNTGDSVFDNRCDVLRIRQSAYTLVVYSQRINDESNSNWTGASRLIRYELSKYDDLATLSIRDGYRDPTVSSDEFASFETWESDGTPEGTSAVLTDFVQDPTLPFDRDPLANSSASSCLNLGAEDADGDPATADTPLYTILPTNANNTRNTSFFACVRNPDPDNNPDTTTRANQDIYVFLRGSTDGASGGVSSFSEESSLPILETQVLVKGVIDKALQN